MGNQEDLSAGLKWIKYLLIGFNMLFATTGMMLIVSSVLVGQPMSALAPILTQRYISPTSILIVIGVGVLVVSGLGIYGAFRHSTAMVTCFSLAMAVLLLFEISAGLAVFFDAGAIYRGLRHNLEAAMNDYPDNKETANTVDFMQNMFNCCGVSNVEDWKNVPIPADAPYYGGRYAFYGSDLVVPYSCCSALSVNDSPEFSTSSPAVYCVVAKRYGCLRKLLLFISRSESALASTAIVVALTQFLGILFACVLGRSIRRQKTMREVRRVQIRNDLVNTYAPLETKPIPPITITY